MRLAEGVLLVLDGEAIPFSRIWCDYELFTTISDPLKKLDMIAFRGKPRLLTQTALPNEPASDKRVREQKFPLSLLKRGMELNLQDGNASVEQDKVKILSIMARDPKTGLVDTDQDRIDLANRAIRGYLALSAWPQALKHGVVQSFKLLNDTKNLSLVDVMRSDQTRTHIEFSFSGLEVSDQDICAIASGLPPRIEHLILSFESCGQISDAGIAYLSAALARLPLRRLHLDLLGCKLLTDDCMHSLSSSLPQSLNDLTLDLSLCSQISKSGVKIFSDELPASVSKLHASFRGTRLDKIFKSPAQLKQAVGK
jgi:hypothetical protein